MIIDKITISGLKVFAYHGALPEEQKHGQDFYINAVLSLDCRKAAENDRLEDAVNYAEVCETITKSMQEKRFDLIEAACGYVSERLLLSYEKLQEVEVEVCKPHAPIGLPFENVSVSMKRGWHRAYLSFGSNMGDRQRYIEQGIQEFSEHPRMRNVRVSAFRETEPYGYLEQEPFLNGALECETLLEAEELLDFVHEVEARAGRERKIHWGPRTLDLDIIFFDKLVYESDRLVIPHIDMENRQFVLEPLSELCPNYRHPVLRKTVSQLAEPAEK